MLEVRAPAQPRGDGRLRAPGRRPRAPLPAGPAGGGLPGLKDTDCRATVSFESLHIRIPLKFCQNSAKSSQFFRNSENFRTSQHFLECSAKFREKNVKINASSLKIIGKKGFLQKFEQNYEKSLTIFCKDFEFGAVRRCANLVDLAKC